MAIDFYFNQKTQRYHYADGPRKYEFISKEKVRGLVREHIDDTKEKVSQKTQELLSNKISLGEWETYLAQTLKETSIQFYKIGNPKLGQDPQNDFRDYGRIGANLRTEYAYLRRFSAQIADGKLSPAQINARAKQYIEGAYFNFESGKKESHKRTGWIWERRWMSPVEHCKDCPVYAAQGWVPIGTLPGIGQRCQCGSNDKCYFEYSKSAVRPVVQNQKHWLLKQGGWIA